jgi:hypothetical protein
MPVRARCRDTTLTADDVVASLKKRKSDAKAVFQSLQDISAEDKETAS